MSEMTLSAGVVVERVGDELVALVPGLAAVRVSGEAARYVQQLLDGNPAVASDEVIAGLVDAGVLERPHTHTRRRVLGVGAAAVGAGVATLAFPSVAAAASTPTALSGSWFWIDLFAAEQLAPVESREGYQDPTWDRTFEVNLPDGFVGPSGSPGVLTVLNTQVAFKYRIEGDGGELDGFGFFTSPGTDVAVEKTEPLVGTITGSFVWGGVTYQVTFTQTADEPRVS